jgi:hypothetical protein
MNEAALARLVRDGAGIVEGAKGEELMVAARPVLRGFRYGSNIHLSNTAKLFNCAALEVYVDGQRFTLYPESDMEVRPGTTARMEVEPTAARNKACSTDASGEWAAVERSCGMGRLARPL